MFYVWAGSGQKCLLQSWVAFVGWVGSETRIHGHVSVTLAAHKQDDWDIEAVLQIASLRVQKMLNARRNNENRRSKVSRVLRRSTHSERVTIQDCLSVKDRPVDHP